MNILLIGYRGTGKSTIARLVAERLGWNWGDADTYLEELAGRSIRQIFETDGEAGFRDRETAVIEELARRDQVVIAAGGGAVLRAENRAAMRRSGKVVWLTASPETIERRLASDSATAERRPPLTPAGGEEEIRRLLVERAPHYLACADLIVDTGSRSPAQVADEVLELLAPLLPRPSRSG